MRLASALGHAWRENVMDGRGSKVVEEGMKRRHGSQRHGSNSSGRTPKQHVEPFQPKPPHCCHTRLQ
eukprot:2813844-Prymnesium_polylepis.1